MAPRQVRSEGSWSSLHQSEASGDNIEDGYTDESMGDASDEDDQRSLMASPTFPTISDVHRALHPLQATADRVGKQVEQFAENLDRISTEKRKKSHARKDCRHVLGLVEAYRGIAHNTVKSLQKLHATERQKELFGEAQRRLQTSSRRSQSGSRRGKGGKGDDVMTTVEDLKRWEREEQTWDLLGCMLLVDYPIPEDQRGEFDSAFLPRRPKDTVEIHCYSSEKEVWHSFLATNDQAWERQTVLKWLQRCADNPQQDIKDVVEELESGAERGGLWAHSWLYSKEAIKGQKRLRSWKTALEPNEIGLSDSLLNSEKTKALVTQLDPDAITRQGRNLERQDYSFERATWLACWEMLRRGKDWEFIQEWCRERVEGWRAAAMRGDLQLTPFSSNSVANWQSRILWRKTCAIAANEGGIDEYERAVYGLLSGYLPAVQKVCRSWDDFLFAQYNSYLLHSFEQHLKQKLPARVPIALRDGHGPLSFSAFGGQRGQSGNHIVEKLKEMNTTKAEATEPFKMIQGSIIAKNFERFILHHGIKLAEAANGDGESKILSPMDTRLLDGAVTASISMDDHDLLRLLTHMIFIYQDLDLNFSEDPHRQAIENIVVAYIDYLGKAGKQQLLPLYASRLSYERSISCLARQLPLIQNSGERQTMLRLMAQYDIWVPGVLSSQLKLIKKDTTPLTVESTQSYDLKILKRLDDDVVKLRPIRADFLCQTMTDNQEDLIRAFEWFLMLDGRWKYTMSIGAVIYKHFLRFGAFAAARALSKTVTFSSISLRKTQVILGRSVDLSTVQDEGDDDLDEADLVSSHDTGQGRDQERRHSSSIRNDKQILLNQARSFRDFEGLFVALDALEDWRHSAEDAKNCKQQTAIRMRELKSAMRKSYQRVDASIDPLLHDWLQNPRDDIEMDEFKQIRRNCLPEIILAYIYVLDTSSHYLSRDLLLKGMDLAALIANNESGLAACFVAADRMAELVDAFACMSKTVILADDMGAKSGKSKRTRNGETLGLWTVRAPQP